jgi:hypothetical protein
VDRFSLTVSPPLPDDPYWRVEVEDPALDWRLQLRFEREEPQTYTLVGLALDPGKPLSNRTLPRVQERLDHYVGAATAALTASYPELRARVDQARRRQRKRRGGGLTDDFYKSVAEEWRSYRQRNNGTPTTSLARAHGVSRSTAGRWVKRAREMGML